MWEPNKNPKHLKRMLKKSALGMNFRVFEMQQDEHLSSWVAIAVTGSKGSGWAAILDPEVLEFHPVSTIKTMIMLNVKMFGYKGFKVSALSDYEMNYEMINIEG